MNRCYQKCVQAGFSSPFHPGAGVCGTHLAVGLRMWLLPPLSPLKVGNLSAVVRWGLWWARLLVCLGQPVIHQPGRRSGCFVSCPGRVFASNSGFPLVSCNLFYLAEDDVVWSPPPCSSYASHNHLAEAFFVVISFKVINRCVHAFPTFVVVSGVLVNKATCFF